MTRTIVAVVTLSTLASGAAAQFVLVEDLRTLDVGVDIELTDPDNGEETLFFSDSDSAEPLAPFGPFDDFLFAHAEANPLDWGTSTGLQISAVTPTQMWAQGRIDAAGRFDFVVPPAIMSAGGISRFEVAFEVEALTLVRVTAELSSGSPTQYAGTFGAAITQTSLVIDELPFIEVVTNAQAVEIQELTVSELVRLEPGTYKQLFLAQAGVGAVTQDDPEDSAAEFDARLDYLGTMCSEADMAPPFGVLDFSDVVAFLGAFAAGNQAADVAPPIGTHDFTDVVVFLERFGVGCP